MTNKLIHGGNIYFFYRPKVEKENEVQRFFLVLYSLVSHRYYLLVVGKKHFPVEKEGGYFAFLEAIKENQNDLLQSLKEKTYSTNTRGERTLPTARCLGAGKFLLVEHGNHTHFVYQLSVPKTIKSIQTEFNLKKEDDYLISVKNPQASTPQGAGLKEGQKTSYPSHLQEKFAGYRFVSLSSFEFFNHLGTELLLVNPGKTSLIAREEETRKCFSGGVNENELVAEWAKITPPEAIVPLEE